MSTRIEEVVLTDSAKAELESAINEYYSKNEEYKVADANKKTFNKVVKQLLQDNGINKYTTDSGIKVSLTKTVTPSFCEEQLIPFLKELNIPNVIKTREYVDMEVLEDAIYHNLIDPKLLAPFKEDTVVYRLNCSKPKILNE